MGCFCAPRVLFSDLVCTRFAFNLHAFAGVLALLPWGPFGTEAGQRAPQGHREGEGGNQGKGKRRGRGGIASLHKAVRAQGLNPAHKPLHAQAPACTSPC